MHASMYIESYLFLSNISHECINIISLLNQPGKDTGCIYDAPYLSTRLAHDVGKYIPSPPEYANNTRPLDGISSAIEM